MHTSTAFERREALTDGELARLRAQLVIEVERYREAIRGYSPEKMADYGAPFLAGLEARVAEVDKLIELRSNTR